MGNDTLQDILAGINQPSRYLGTEANRVRKDPAHVRLRFALAFPDLYDIGTSHFGMQILYEILNRDARIAAERVFAPAADMTDALAARGLPLGSLESGRPLGKFDILGFSLLYELNYTNVPGMLAAAGIPFRAADRDKGDPLVIAGGPCTCNPEPLASFFDAMVIGDGEEVVPALAEAWLDWDGRSKDDLLDRWGRIDGVYVPGRFEARYEGGLQRLAAKAGTPPTVRRAVVADLDRAPFPDRPIVPFGRPVHDRLRIEIARGCTRGCRFCQAGMIYRPVRERAPERLMALTRKALAGTGYEDVSLLSLSTGDYSCINRLAEALMTEYAERHVSLSLPSLRAGTLSPGLMSQIRRVRKTGFTIAVEAGSQRLRNVINKNIEETDIFDTVRDAFDLGWQTIKLYFMIGLPTETDADRQAIVALVDRLRRLRPAKGPRGKINVSLATFIPKAHTPFQWAGQMPLADAAAVIDEMRRKLNKPGVHVKWQNPQVSWIEGLWARGDRRLDGLLEAAYRRGCRFDGWSDQFRFDRWQEAIAARGIDADFFVPRTRDLQEPLPWEHVDIGVDKAYLQKEWQNAMDGQLTGDCRQGACQGCGVCDFERIAPVVHEGAEVTAPQVAPLGDKEGFRPVRIGFRKIGPARLFGHLETLHLFQRALRRAGVSLQYSGGFHPKARIVFEDALPVGIESLNEAVTIHAQAGVDPETIAARLDHELPEGFEVFAAAMVSAGEDEAVEGYRYRVYGAVRFAADRLREFQASDSWMMERISAKGRRQVIDMKQAVMGVRLEGDGLEMQLRRTQGPVVRPGDVLREVFKLNLSAQRRVRIVKLGGPGPLPERKPCSAN